MGRTEYRIINGKEYLVYINDEGCETVIGDPMKDEAEAHARAIEEVLDRNRNTYVEPTPHKFDEEMEERLRAVSEMSKRNAHDKGYDTLDDYNRIIAYHERAGHYKPDPKYGVPQFIKGTDETNPEYLKRMNKDLERRRVAADRHEQTLKGIWLLIVIVAVIGLATLFVLNYK